MEEIKIPNLEMSTKNNQEKYLITSVVSEENKEYFLYSDGKLYEKDDNGKLQMVDNVTSESKELIKKIMENLKPGKTDIYEPEKIAPVTKQEIEVDEPEL